MNITVQYLRAILHAMLIMLWTPAIVYASTSSLQSTINGVSGDVLVLVGVLSSLTGATALVMRIDKELRASLGAVLPRPYLFAASHMMGSWLAGALGFMVAEASGVLSGWAELCFISAASFSGAKFIEALVEKCLLKGQP